MKTPSSYEPAVKKLMFLLIAGFLMLASCKRSEAQWVAIPDTVFRAYLYTQVPAAMNGAYMDTTSWAVLFQQDMNLSNLNVYSLEGIQYFDSLQELFCWEDTFLQVIPMFPPLLKNLTIYYSPSLQTLPTLPDSLEYAFLSQNHLTSLPALPNGLERLYCWENYFTSLPSLPDSLRELDVYRNQISSIPPLPDSLRYLNINFNPISSIPPLPPKLQWLDIGITAIDSSSFPVLPNSLINLRASWLNLGTLPPLPTNLTELEARHSQLNCLPFLPNSIKNLYVSFNNVTCLPNIPDSLQTSDIGTTLCTDPVNISVTNVSCDGNNDGSIVLTINNCGQAYTFLWSNGSTDQNLANLTTGVYSCIITDINLINDTISVTLTQPAPLTIVTPSVITVCQGTGLCVAAAGGTPPYTYQWSVGVTSACLLTTLSGTYTVTITDANSCSVTGTFTLTVAPNPLIDSIFPTMLPTCGFCDGTINIDASNGTPPYTFQYNPPLAITGVCDGITYQVTIVDFNGCIDTSSFLFSSCRTAVWPGDANYDGTATNIDLLSIGIGYGTAGPIRPNATIAWTAQAAPDWLDTLAGGTNYRHVDCNGDGIINDADTVAIIQNYGQTHPLRIPPTPQNLLDPYLYFDIAIDTAGTSQQIDVPLMFGTASVPADSIYGLGFTVNYDTSLVKADSIGISFSPSWIGTTGTDMITIQQNQQVTGKLHVGMTRIDHNNTSGFGQIAKVTVVTVDNVSGKMASSSLFDTLTFTLSDVVVIDKNENIRNVNLSSDSLIVEDSTTSIHEFLSPEKIKIYPNPVKDKLFVKVPPGYIIGEISISNTLGENMESEFILRNNFAEIRNLKNFSNGIYFIEIKTDSGNAVKKFSVIK